MFKRNPLINPNAMSISIIDSGATPTAHLTSEMLLQGLGDIALGMPPQLLTQSILDGDVEVVAAQEQDVAVDHPEHYRQDSGLEAIEVIEAWDLNFNLGNVVKYVCRAGIKNSETTLEDLKKAAWYLDREIKSKE